MELEQIKMASEKLGERQKEIVYFTDNAEARRLLRLLENKKMCKKLNVVVTEGLTYNKITSEGISSSVIEKLCEFGMVKTSESIEDGTEEYLYSITAYGEKFFNAFDELFWLDIM